jgi:hypothetical protein
MPALDPLDGANTEGARIGQILLRPATLEPKLLAKHSALFGHHPKSMVERPSAPCQRPDTEPDFPQDGTSQAGRGSLSVLPHFSSRLGVGRISILGVDIAERGAM